MSELKQSIAQLLIDNFKGTTSKRASDMAIAIMAFVNADRDRQAGYCAPSSTGECSCRKWADDPMQCERRTQPEATKPAQDLSAVILEKLVRYEPIAVQSNGYEWGIEMISDKANEWRFVEFDDVRSLVKRASSPADTLVAGDRVDAEEK